MNILKDISLEALKRAAEIRQQILDLENELEAILSGESKGKGRRAAKKKTGAKKKRGKRKLSPEARERIIEAQRKRWAKVKKKAAKKAPAKKK